MKTPICDFVEKYAQNDNLRLHMPGHKGMGTHGERFDITEISGADSLYEASGIIAESEGIASELFGARTFYSTEGSSQVIRAMMYLVMLYAKEKGEKPLVFAGRNAHKTFVSAAALLGFDVKWLTSQDGSYLSCKLTVDEVREYLENSGAAPTALYLTSPDYLGNTVDIGKIADLCHSRGVLLIVDNAHGAYLHFLPMSRHPIALGADMCCDSAHKTLPALTGASYLHISKSLPNAFADRAKSALSLFGSTSPSYLILASMDRTNAYLANGYREILSGFCLKISELKRELEGLGYTFIGDEPIKLTISAKKYGYTGYEMASHLERAGIFPEFADPDYLVLMLTPENEENALGRLKTALLSLPEKEAILTNPPPFSLPRVIASPRDAILSPSETIPVEAALGRVLASVTVGCPPAVPVVVSGEEIDHVAIECFKYYGITTCSVIKNEKSLF